MPLHDGTSTIWLALLSIAGKIPSVQCNHLIVVSCGCGCKAAKTAAKEVATRSHDEDFIVHVLAEFTAPPASL